MRVRVEKGLGGGSVKNQVQSDTMLDRVGSIEPTATTSVANPHEDVAALKQYLRDYQVQTVELAVQYDWARQVAEVMAQRPAGALGQWLPFWIWRRILARRLKKRNLFDVERYAARYPDVPATGADPLVHFLRHGLAEKREGAYMPAPSTSAPGADERFVAAIVKSGLLDRAWYCATYSTQAETDEEAALDYVRQSRQDMLVNPGPLFSGIFYLSQNPDVRGIHPLDHYLRFGMQEGRRAFSPNSADAFIESSADLQLEKLHQFLDKSKKTVVLHWEKGNFFFTDIAQYLAEVLNLSGYKASARDNDIGVTTEDHNIIVIAPHEYCVHGPGREWSDSRLEHAIFVNTEQWHTSWFSLALGFILKSRKVVDINPASARGLLKLGARSAFLPLLPYEETIFALEKSRLSAKVSARRVVKPLTYPDEFTDRPYDILFVGALNERRGRVLASLAETLSEYNAFIHCPKLSGPVTPDDLNMIGSQDIAQIAANSKILLNLHQGESRYFEWHRLFLSGICEGCVVVTEPCVDTGILKAGDHYLEASAEVLPDYIDWLLGTDEGLAKMLHVSKSCEVLLLDIMSKELIA